MTSQTSPTHAPCLAYFVTSHGYGHAARSAAVMRALSQRYTRARFVIFTQTPRWFFQETLSDNFEYVSIQTDVGMIQASPTRENIAASIAALEQFRSTFNKRRDRLAADLSQLNCNAVLCDISPLGLAAAQKARIPNILIENFTWDWIYENYDSQIRADFRPYAEFLAPIFKDATYHIQTEPVCQAVSADLRTAPVSRPIKRSREMVRSRLAVPAESRMVVVSMGGIPAHYPRLDFLDDFPNVQFVIPGGTRHADKPIVSKNLVLLPEHSDLYHPDLIHAADAVIGKVGYSTLAEVYHAGVPFGYVLRPAFPESPHLAAFIESHITGVDFAEGDFYHGKWGNVISKLLRQHRTKRRVENGADQIALYIKTLLTL